MKAKEQGQALVDFIMLLTVILGMLSLVYIAFKPTKQKIVDGIKDSVRHIISTGSVDLDVKHPLLDERVNEL